MKRLQAVTVLASIFALIGSTQPVFAFTEGACKADVQKFCADMKPGKGNIHDCLNAHEGDLSQACKDNMAEMKEKMQAKMKEVKDACQADLKQYCSNVTPGEGREIACLHAYSDKVSAGCKAALPKHHMMMHKEEPSEK